MRHLQQNQVIFYPIFTYFMLLFFPQTFLIRHTVSRRPNTGTPNTHPPTTHLSQRLLLCLLLFCHMVQTHKIIALFKLLAMTLTNSCVHSFYILQHMVYPTTVAQVHGALHLLLPVQMNLFPLLNSHLLDKVIEP